MRELKSKRLIIAKGLMLLGIATSSMVLVLLEAPSVRMAFLLATLVWSASRFYYFLFYVLEKYVDPTLRYAGLLALVGQLLHRR